MRGYVRIFISYFRYEFTHKNRNIIVFAGSYNIKYSFNSRYLFEYYLDKHPEYKSYYIMDDDKLRNKLQQKYGNYFLTTKNKRDLRIIFKAATWITCGGLPIRIPYANRKRVVVNLGHGMPFKGLGLCNNENSFLQNWLIRFIYSKYDLISSTSELFQQILMKSYSCELNQVKVLGNVWNDQLWERRNRQILLYDIFGDTIPDFQFLFLYAPTWRLNEPARFFPFKDFDIEKLEYFLAEHKMIIFCRMHQLDKYNIKRFSSLKRVILMNEDKVSDIMCLLNIFDGLISDYSSIIFDYLLLDRPIILLPYDKDSYLKERSLNFDFESMLFNNPPTSFSDFLNSLRLSKDHFVLSEKQKRFKMVVHRYLDNKNCRRHFEEIEKLICCKL